MAAAALARALFAMLGRGARATGRGVGRTAKYGAAAGIGGGLALGVNPLLGLMAGNAIRNMKWPGGKGGGITGAGAAGGAAATRDTTITAGERAHSETRGRTLPVLSKKADFRTAINWIANATKLTYGMSVKNNAEIIHLQKMFQGIGAARAKELRMESQRKALVPIIYNTTIIQGDGGGGRGMGMLPMAGLAAAAAAIAGMVAGIDDFMMPSRKAPKPFDWKTTRRTQGMRRGWVEYLQEQRAKAEAKRLADEIKEERARNRANEFSKRGPKKIPWWRRVRITGNLLGGPSTADRKIAELKRIRVAEGKAIEGDPLRSKSEMMRLNDEIRRLEAEKAEAKRLADEARRRAIDDKLRERFRVESKKSITKPFDWKGTRRFTGMRYGWANLARIWNPLKGFAPNAESKIRAELIRARSALVTEGKAIEKDPWRSKSEWMRLNDEIRRLEKLRVEAGRVNASRIESIKARNAWLRSMDLPRGYRFTGATTKVGAPIAEPIRDPLRSKADHMRTTDAFRAPTEVKGGGPGSTLVRMMGDNYRSFYGVLERGLSGINRSIIASGIVRRLNSLGLMRLTSTLGSGLTDIARRSGIEIDKIRANLDKARSLFTKAATPTTRPTGGIVDRPPLGEGKMLSEYMRMKLIKTSTSYLTGKKVLANYAIKAITPEMIEALTGEKGAEVKVGQRVSQKLIDAARGLTRTAGPIPTGPKIPDIKLPKPGEGGGRRVQAYSGYKGATQPMSEVEIKRATNNLKGQIHPAMAAWGANLGKLGFRSRYQATHSVAELPGPLNRMVNWVFIGIIIGALFDILWKWFADEYDPTDEVNNRAIALQALAQLGVLLTGAIIIWVIVGVLLRVALSTVATALAAIPTPLTWLMAAGVFAFKFWAVDFVLANIGNWWPLMAKPFPPYFPEGLFPPHKPMGWEDVLNFKEKVKQKFTKLIGSGGLDVDQYKAIWAMRGYEFPSNAFGLIAPQLTTTDQSKWPVNLRSGGGETKARTVIPQTSISPFSALGAMIMSGESARRGYNDWAPGKKSAAGLPDLTKQTIKSVLMNQKDRYYGAVGKYQLIRSTLKMAVANGVVKESDIFNEATQEKLFKWLLLKKRPKELGAYLEGTGSTLERAQIAMAKEWAAVGVPKAMIGHKGFMLQEGQSYYAGVGDNKASIKASDIGLLLQQLRLAIMAQAAESKAAGNNPQASNDTTIVVGGDSIVTAANTNFYPWKAHLEIPNQGLAYG